MILKGYKPTEEKKYKKMAKTETKTNEIFN